MRIQRSCVGACIHEVRVRRIGIGYNIRVFINGEINQECRVYERRDISSEIYQMLRMEDKCGNISKMASRSRERFNEKLNRLS